MAYSKMTDRQVPMRMRGGHLVCTDWGAAHRPWTCLRAFHFRHRLQERVLNGTCQRSPGLHYQDPSLSFSAFLGQPAVFKLATDGGVSLLGKSSLVLWNPLF